MGEAAVVRPKRRSLEVSILIPIENVRTYRIGFCPRAVGAPCLAGAELGIGNGLIGEAAELRVGYRPIVGIHVVSGDGQRIARGVAIETVALRPGRGLCR